MDRAFSPEPPGGGFFLGRCPRLVWEPAFSLCLLARLIPPVILWVSHFIPVNADQANSSRIGLPMSVIGTGRSPSYRFLL